MVRPFIPHRKHPHLRDARQGERGVTMALVAVSLFAIIAMAGLSIDIGTLYQASDEAQRAADAGALAAARTISMSGMTSDPTNTTNSWQPVCGTGGAATLAAITAAQQNLVGGTMIPTSKISVTYSTTSATGGVTDCSSLDASTGSTPPGKPTTAFGVNPVVTVTVTQPGLPTFFSRIWGRTGSSVSATASAEVFNPSGSENFSSSGNVVPVQPRCVKPWIVPNENPLLPKGCAGTTCDPFVSTSDGSIVDPGLSASGVIGEQFELRSDCGASAGSCTISPDNPPIATTGAAAMLDYVPASVSGTSVGVPSCASGLYQQAIAGCDETTVYQCGVQAASAATATSIDYTENPGASDDTETASECLTHASGVGLGVGQDGITTGGVFPFPITAGSANPLKLGGSQITSSSSIVSLPIYDSGTGTPLATTPPQNVTIIGFLQVFINQAVNARRLQVTVLNVAGCGNGAAGNVASTPITGTSPVPVRLITPP
jgi:hypothetical protein